MKKNKKQRKNSLLTIGAFAVVGILIVGTIVGIAAGGLFSGDSKDEDSIPLTRQLKNTDAATATAATAETEKPEEQTKEPEASPASGQATADTDSKQNSETEKPKKTSKPKKTKKPKSSKNPSVSAERTPSKNDNSQDGQGKTGQDNEILFSEFE